MSMGLGMEALGSYRFFRRTGVDSGATTHWGELNTTLCPLLAGGGTQKLNCPRPPAPNATENVSGIRAAPCRAARNKVFTPTPYIVIFSPYLIVEGRMLSISRGSETRSG